MAAQTKKSVISSAFYILFAIICSIFCFSITSCDSNQKEEKNLSRYYFPIDSLENGLVYEYQSLEDDTKEYWFYKRFISGDSIFLLGQNYDKYMQVRQFQKELITERGAELMELILFDAGPNGNISTPVNITSPDIFSFHPMDSTKKLIYQVNWEDKTQEMGIDIIKNRYQGKVNQMEFGGASVNYLKIKLSELISTKQDGHLDLEWYGEEWYAENIGLAYYFKETPTGEKFAYRLVKRTDLDSFIANQNFE